ncbi:MAG TPA: hypothetical protein VMX56_04425 [Anaerolineales bacterium]|nr:hypothetical protein [Anaerolineales bacterium]
MTWTNCAKGALAVLLLVFLSGNSCESTRVDMDKVIEELRRDAPPQYHACLDREATKLPKGSITWKEAQTLIVDLRESELAFQRCGKNARAYYRAKINAFATAYYQQF